MLFDELACTEPVLDQGKVGTIPRISSGFLQDDISLDFYIKYASYGASLH